MRRASLVYVLTPSLARSSSSTRSSVQLGGNMFLNDKMLEVSPRAASSSSLLAQNQQAHADRRQRQPHGARHQRGRVRPPRHDEVDRRSRGPEPKAVQPEQQEHEEAASAGPCTRTHFYGLILFWSGLWSE